MPGRCAPPSCLRLDAFSSRLGRRSSVADYCVPVKLLLVLLGRGARPEISQCQACISQDFRPIAWQGSCPSTQTYTTQHDARAALILPGIRSDRQMVVEIAHTRGPNLRRGPPDGSIEISAIDPSRGGHAHWLRWLHAALVGVCVCVDWHPLSLTLIPSYLFVLVGYARLRLRRSPSLHTARFFLAL